MRPSPNCSARAFPEKPREYGLARMFCLRTLGTNYKFTRFKDGARIEICGHGCMVVIIERFCYVRKVCDIVFQMSL